MLASEALFHISAALDSLVFELAWLDSGNEVDRTQFPIERTAKGWMSRRNTYHRGVHDDHVEKIERFQPYLGCDWTRQLQELSNADKHRRLVRIERGAGFDLANVDFRPIRNDPARVRAKVPSARILVELADGTQVQESLWSILMGAGEAVDTFAETFGVSRLNLRPA